MHVHYWTSVSLRRLYISQFPSLHFKDRDDGFVSKGSKDVLHGNKIFPCIIEFTKSASFVVIFVVVCGHLGRIYDLCFGQKCWLTIIHVTKINYLVAKLYEVFSRLQAFLFSFLWGIKVGIQRKQILHSRVADQSTGFMFARGSHFNV